MDEHLASTADGAIVERLDYLDILATHGDDSSRAALATTEIARLTGAWRSLLEQHAPDENGRCPQCSGWWRQRRHPCTVWLTAHEHLVADGGASTTGASGKVPASEPMIVTKLRSSRQRTNSTGRWGASVRGLSGT